MYALIAYYQDDIFVVETSEDKLFLYGKLLDTFEDYLKSELFYDTNSIKEVRDTNILKVYDTWFSKLRNRPDIVFKICKI